MVADYQKTGSPDGQGVKSPESRAEKGKNNDCRCKEASRMTPRQLLKLMINDLMVWKKQSKG